MGCAVVAYCRLNTIVLFISCCETYVALPKHLLGFSFIVLGGKPWVGSQNGNLRHGRVLWWRNPQRKSGLSNRPSQLHYWLGNQIENENGLWPSADAVGQPIIFSCFCWTDVDEIEKSCCCCCLLLLLLIVKIITLINLLNFVKKMHRSRVNASDQAVDHENILWFFSLFGGDVGDFVIVADGGSGFW